MALEVIRQLLQDHDIVLEQFRPGVMERLGLGYQALKAINPKLIYVSITGYGQTGPYRDRAGHDINYLALAGLASYTGRADSGPLPLGIQAADIAGGSLHGVIGLLAAVIARQQSGLGQHLDVSMTDCAFSLNAMAGAGYLPAAWSRGAKTRCSMAAASMTITVRGMDAGYRWAVWNRRLCSNCARRWVDRNWRSRVYRPNPSSNRR